jgi:hypothetical protein
MTLLEILRAAGINEQKAVLPSLQIQPHVGSVCFDGEFGKKMAMSLFGTGW